MLQKLLGGRTFRGLIGRRSAWVAAAAVAVALLPVVAGAQLDETPLGAEQPRDEVQLRVARLGVGGVVRPGEWIGVLVEVTDTTAQSRTVVLRLTAFDRDGDVPQFDREIATTLGATSFAWLYTRLPADGTGYESIEIAAYEGIEIVVEEQPGALSNRAGRLLGRVTAPLTAQPSVGAVGVIGFGAFGLDQYGRAFASSGGGTTSFSTTQHERTRVAAGLDLRDLPDRWQGLMPFETLVWGPGPPETNPLAMSTDQAAAIGRWVERGGHLVVILPTLGQPWATPQNPLFEILPRLGPIDRREGVSYEPYRRLLTSSETAVVPDSGVVQAMVPASDAGRTEAMPILEGPEGETVAMRRLVGAGAVTFIGLDLQNSRLSRSGLPRADAFWNRVLGRRGPVLSNDELQRQFQNGGLAQGRRTTVLDGDLDESIDQSGAAAVGVLVGVVMFVAYWLAAGPVGFFLLKSRGAVRHAWVAFVATSGVFTAAAWAIATSIRPQTVRAQHVTIYDHVHGQELARGRSWQSVLVPFYGTVSLGVPPGGADDGEGGSASVSVVEDLGVFGRLGSGNLLSPWEATVRGVGFGSGFPDNRSYRVDARGPEAWSAPARQTIKQLRADWAGPVEAATEGGLGGITPVKEPGDFGDGRIEWNRVTGDTPLGEQPPILSGSIVHDFPVPLEDVVIVVVESQRSVPLAGASIGNAVIATAWETSPRAADRGGWRPGVQWDLSTLTQRRGENRIANATRFLDDLAEVGTEEGLSARVPEPLRERLVAASLFGQLGPPSLGESAVSAVNRSPRVVRRKETIGYDMGRWFTQPCLIVMGVLRQEDSDRSPVPVPVLVEGERVRSSGLTLVRWVYPLDPAPPRYLTEDGGDDAVGGADGEGS